VKLEVNVDGRQALLTLQDGRFRYERNGRVIEHEFSIVPLAPGSFSVLIEGRSHEVVGGAVNGRPFSVEVFDPRGMRARRTAGADEGPQNIAAQMPGKVVRLLVSRGDLVESGQGLVVVEAMKMQNEMKSPKAGRVAQIKTRPDATVAAGEVLLVIE